MLLTEGDVLEPFTPRKIRLDPKEARLSGILRDFSPHEAVIDAGQILSLANEAMEPLLNTSHSVLPSPSYEMLETVRAEAFAMGLAQGKQEMRQELTQQFDHERAELAAHHHERIEAAKAAVAIELAADLQQALDEGLSVMRHQLEQALASLIAQVMTARLTREAVGDFAARITHATMASTQPVVIEGNKTLLAAFADQTDLAEERYQLQPTNSSEIRVVWGDDVISTRLAPLIQELMELL